ncbi:MAG TPA: pentapeptide repeat-containing protein [Mycobacterium sp.]|nr:pentapeptide repeat-containing protein [Mycobacterium sp.]
MTTKKHEIRSRWDNSVLFTAEVAVDDPNPTRTAVEAAVLVNARLDGASLDGASLVNARLDGASLVNARLDGASLVNARLDGARLVNARLVNARLDGASLDGARLDGARLDGARLDGARLDGARLDGVSLDGARLDGASLDGARLDGASVDGASLVNARLVNARLDGASLVNARLDGARLDGARFPSGFTPPPPLTPEQKSAMEAEWAARDRQFALDFRARHPDIPVVERIDAQILSRVEANRSCFSMRDWHCGTTHCRAGHAVDLAGEAGYALERRLGSTAHAGGLIYLASVGRWPYFYGDDEPALADIRRRAAEQPASDSQT